MNSNTLLYYNRVVPVSMGSLRYVRYIVSDRRALAKQRSLETLGRQLDGKAKRPRGSIL
jgi:hypothetical protein